MASLGLLRLMGNGHSGYNQQTIRLQNRSRKGWAGAKLKLQKESFTQELLPEGITLGAGGAPLTHTSEV